MSEFKIIKENGKFWQHISESGIEYISLGNVAIGLKPNTNVVTKVEVSTGALLMQKGFTIGLSLGAKSKAAQVLVFTEEGRLVFTAYGKFNKVDEAEDFAKACEDRNILVMKEGF